MFCRLFEKEPSAKALFGNVNVDDMDSPEFTAHCIRVTSGLDTIINLAFDGQTLEEALAHLSNQHAQYEGMKREYLTVSLIVSSYGVCIPGTVDTFTVTVNVY